MDPITVLQNRIEQLEAKLGIFTAGGPDGQQGQQGDSATSNQLNTAQAVNRNTVGHEKLMANELNNYTDPNFVEMREHQEKHMQGATAAEPVLRHCACMHRCRQAVPVLESQPIQHVPEMQETVNIMHQATAEVKTEADAVSTVSNGIQEIGESCGAAVATAAAQPAGAAQKVDQVEQKLFPQRRNGLD